MPDRRIWKFPLAVTDYQTVKMPAGSKVLSAAMVRGQLVAYALCDPNAEVRERTCLIAGTGNLIGEYANLEWVETMDFIGTVQMLDGVLVWHVFFGQQSGRAGYSGGVGMNVFSKEEIEEVTGKPSGLGRPS